jgi:hypothetical protein
LSVGAAALFDRARRGVPLGGIRTLAVRGIVTIGVAAFDWNCPQHLPQRLEADDADQAIARRDARIAELEARVAALTAAAG